MAFREVHMTEVREVLRLRLQGRGVREIARLGPVDRKTVRRYLEAAEKVGLRADGDESQLSEELVAAVAEEVQGRGPGGRGTAWKLCESHRGLLSEWLGADLKLTKVRELFARHVGEAVPYRTLHRFATEELSFGKQRHTVRVNDGEAGEEVQVDFGRMGYLSIDGRRRLVWALVLTACVSRHQFVWLTLRQRLEDVIEGFEQAWHFFGGVFRVVIIDNVKAVVVKADHVQPRLNEGFMEYAQTRGFVVDPTRTRKPDDKPRVERAIPYVRESFFRGESFMSLEHARQAAEKWCRETAGTRTHGTTRRQPLVVFEDEEQPALLPAPDSLYEVPLYTNAKVHRDHHVIVDKALYSVPTCYIGEPVHARADRELVKLYHRGRLIKTHPRQAPGGRSTDPKDYPEEKALYATRDQKTLQERAHKAGRSIGGYAERLLDTPQPWMRMRQVYRLLGLVKRYGAERVERACARSLELDVVDVTRISRMLERALEGGGDPRPPSPPRTAGAQLRFARPAAHFAVSHEGAEHESA